MKRLWILLLIGVISLTACASQDKKYVEAKVSIAPTITTSWVLIDWKTPEGNQAIIPKKESRPITLQFDPRIKGSNEATATVRGFSGCNEIQGLYYETENTLNIAKITSTKRACMPIVMKMEMAFVQSISNTSLQKSFRRSMQGRLMILTATEGDQWTFVETSVPQ